MNRVIGSSLLIFGLCVGAATLALPSMLADLGFLPSAVLLFFFWVIMTYTGLLTLEVNLWFASGANFSTMARKSLGPVAGIFTWVAYVLLLYLLIAAYLAGDDSLLLLDLHTASSSLQTHFLVGMLPWLILLPAVLFIGVSGVDFINRVLIAGLILCVVFLIIVGYPHINPSFLKLTAHPHTTVAVVPLIITAFGYHILIPTIRDYLHGDIYNTRRAIIIGTGMALVVYLIWLLFTFGALPVTGPHSLHAVMESDAPAAAVVVELGQITQNPLVVIAARLFGFFAIATSFVTVVLSLADFFADSLKINKASLSGRTILLLIVFVPPVSYALLYPANFLSSLSFAGVLLVVLYGVLPVLMIWGGRYVKDLAFGYKVFGGRWMLVGVLLFSALAIYADIKFIHLMV